MAREMKDSGIEWIGEIPKEWKIHRIAMFFSENKYKNTNYEFDRAFKFKYGTLEPKNETGDIEELKETYLAYTIVEENDIVINCLNLNYDFVSQRVAITPYRGIITSAYLILRERTGVDCQYYTYLFKAMDNMKLFHGMGSGVRLTLTYSDLKNQLIVAPCVEEQHRISAFLDVKCSEIDTVLEKTRSSIEEYKKLKQSIITQAVTKGIRPNRPMKDSGIEWIGEIPECWQVTKATHVIRSTQNGLTRRDLEKSEGNIVLKLKNITPDGRIDYSEVNRIALSDAEISNYQLESGDLLFVRVNGSKSLVGKCAIYEGNGEVIAYNDHLIRVKLADIIYERYFYWFLLSSSGKCQIELHTSTAAGQFTINSSGLADISITMPNKNEQIEVCTFLENKCSEIDTLIAKKEQLIAELETYKKSLIYEYVTGKKEVPAQWQSM